MSLRTIVLATHNSGKVRELEIFLKPIGWQVLTALAAGYHGDPEETGNTFEANALIKAKEVSEHVPYAVLADDSGLEVEILKGEPGVFSARYAGIKATDAENRHKLLQAMHGKSHRKARFVCVLCYLEPKGVPIYFRANCEGIMALSEIGDQGFGYDSIFIPEGQTKSFAQMSVEQKNLLSHRGKAITGFIQYLINNSSHLKNPNSINH